jgi:hypothetical protein
MQKKSNDIIVNVIGGLGNQLFQYAVGRTLAERTGGVLKLDITEFKNYEFHSYSLQHFNIKKEYPTKEELREFVRYRPRGGRLGRLLNPLFADPTLYIQEPSYTFNASILELKPPCYLHGYWQSEKYFTSIEHIIRSEFTLATPLSDYAKGVAERIDASKEPVCLHVRRGDFAKHTTVSAFHGTCSLEYYEEAINIIKKTISTPTFFVFSDDIDWAREHIKTGFPTEFVGQGAERNYEDLELMKHCKHHILSNSTFGWWGAWLSKPQESKITIAPKKWFAGKNFDLSDLIPARWIQLQS